MESSPQDDLDELQWDGYKRLLDMIFDPELAEHQRRAVAGHFKNYKNRTGHQRMPRNNRIHTTAIAKNSPRRLSYWRQYYIDKVKTNPEKMERRRVLARETAQKKREVIETSHPDILHTAKAS